MKTHAESMSCAETTLPRITDQDGDSARVPFYKIFLKDTKE